MSRGPLDPRLLRHARSSRTGIGFAALLGAGQAAATTAVAIALTRIVTGQGGLPLLAGAFVLRAALTWAEQVVAQRTAAAVTDELRRSALAAVLNHGPAAVARFGSNRLTAVLGSGLDALRPWFSGYLPALVLGVALPPLVIVAMAVTDLRSALIAVVTLPLIPVLGALIGWATRERARQAWAADARLAGHFLDVVRGLTTLRVYGRATRQISEVRTMTDGHRRATLRVLRVAFLSSTALDLVATLSVGLIAVEAGLRVAAGDLGLAPALLVILLAPEVYRPLREMAARYHASADASAVIADVDEILTSPVAPGAVAALSAAPRTGLGDGTSAAAREPAPAGFSPVGWPPGSGAAPTSSASSSAGLPVGLPTDVRSAGLPVGARPVGARPVALPAGFRPVGSLGGSGSRGGADEPGLIPAGAVLAADRDGRFGFGDARPSVFAARLRVRHPDAAVDALVLDGLAVREGELVALRGPSGAGKTTALRVLAGLQPAVTGRVELSGPGLLYLPQRPTLPHVRTVADVFPGLGPDEVQAALRTVGLDAEVGVATVLGEHGAGVSAGQRQRLALAALLRSAARAPAVLLLDEPTAHLDAAAERLVIERLRAAADQGCAVLAVAHRPHLLAAADRIIDVTPPAPDTTSRTTSSLNMLTTTRTQSTTLTQSTLTTSSTRPAQDGVHDSAVDRQDESEGSHTGQPTVRARREVESADTDRGRNQNGSAATVGVDVVGGQGRAAAAARRPEGQVSRPGDQPSRTGDQPSRTGSQTSRTGDQTSRPGGLASPAGSRVSRLGRWVVRRPGAAVGFGAASWLAGIVLTGAAAWLLVRAATLPPVLTLSTAVVLVRGSAVARPLLRYLERLVAHDVAFARLGEWRAGVFADLVVRVPGPGLRRRGDLLTRVGDDVDARVDGLLRGRLPALAAGLAVGVVVVAAVVVLPVVAVPLAVGLLVAGVAAPALAARQASRLDAATGRARAELADAVVETVDGVEELAVRGAGEDALAVPDRRSRMLARLEAQAARSAGAAAALGLLGWGIAVTGTALVAGGSGLSDEWAAVLLLAVVALGEPVATLPDAAVARRRAAGAGSRLAEISAHPPSAPPVSTDGGSGAAGDGVVVRGLVAGWDPARAPVLDGVDLELPRGSRVAVLGPSGGGKSTLAAVLARLLGVRAGTVTGLTSSVVVGDEADHVFASTVRENLRLARPGATDLELQAALARVRLDGWLAGLPDGLDAWLGTGGGTISGGQRRRLATARALLAEPDLLILDEPTEGLDEAGAAVLMADLLSAVDGRTVLLLTHRTEGLDRVDATYELRDGRLLVGEHRD